MVLDAIHRNSPAGLEKAFYGPANADGPAARADNHELPLHVATLFGSATMVQLLIDAFADPNLFCIDGVTTTTVLHVAASDASERQKARDWVERAAFLETGRVPAPPGTGTPPPAE